MIVFIIGMPGVGKTTIGKRWSKEHHIKFSDLDIFIENYYQKSINQIIAHEGEKKFRELEHIVLNHLIQTTNSDIIVSCGGGTPCFHNNIALMNLHGSTIYIKNTIENIVENLWNDTQSRPLLIKHKTKPTLTHALKILLQERERYYLQAKEIFEVDDKIDSKFALYWTSLNFKK
jgi:shikimate kinase